MRYKPLGAIEKIVVVALCCGSVPAVAQSPGGNSRQTVQSVETLTAELKLIRDQIRQRPEDPQLFYRAGEILRDLGRTAEAARVFAAATKASQDMYIAYHQISVITSDPIILDEAIERLTARSKTKPDELMLRVALSELLEKRGNYQQAARTLIDLTYANKVPEKYKARVSGRIHHLLAVSKNTQVAPEQAEATPEEQLDVVPSPLPAQPSKRSIASARMKDSKEVKGVGKVPLLP